MKYLLSCLLFLVSMGVAHAQDFDRSDNKSDQPALSQPLLWVSAPASAAASLPTNFLSDDRARLFRPYTARTTLPTSTGNDAWAKFTLAGTRQPESWIIRIPRVSIQKVTLYSVDANGVWQAQSAGSLTPQKDWNRSTRTPSFEVMTGALEKSYFLRFEHHSPLTERPELISQLDFADGASRVGALIGLMFGMFGLLIIACVAAYAVAQNTVFLSLAGFTTAVLVYHLVMMGFGDWQIWPDSVYLNQATQWTAPLVALAANCWFVAQASYAKDSHRRIYLLLLAFSAASVLMAVVTLAVPGFLPRDFLNAWSGTAVATTALCLVWLSLRGLRWNWWLVIGLVPLAGAALSRVAYNYGLLARIELTQSVSALLTQLGLLLFFLALSSRSRDGLLSAERTKALASHDPVTGLINPHVAKLRQQQTLLRADRLKLGCGVIMLRWVDFHKLMASQSPAKQDALLKHFSAGLARMVRDIDTAAVLGDGYFLLLVEGPISRSAMSLLGTQVVTSCIRSSEKFDLPNAFQMHIAIWQAGLLPSTVTEVVGALRNRLSQMSAGTKRTVQFVDSMKSEPMHEQQQESTQRRAELIAKIDAIEAAPSMQAMLVTKAS